MADASDVQPCEDGVNCGLTDGEFFRLTRAVREADELFESGKTGGGGTRHWLRDCFLPALEAHGLQIMSR